VSNLSTLNEIFRLGAIDELVTRKQTGAEKMALSAGDMSTHSPLLDALENQLEDAHMNSRLPEEPTSADALNDFVIQLRLQGTA
jgi:hypothetical protein